MQDLTEAYLSVYGNIEEYKTPVTRRSMGIESQFVDKTGEEKAKAKAQRLSNSTNLADRKRAKTITRTIETAADKEAAQAGVEARNRLLRRAKDRIRAARDMNEKRLFPGAPDYAHSFPLSDAEKESARNIGFAAKAKAERQASESPTKSATKKKKKLEFEVRENFYDLVLDYLLDEGYADTQENAISMMSAMSEDWVDSIISEAPFQISGPHPTTVDGTKLDYEPSNVGKPYKNKKRAETKADKLNQEHGANVYRVTKVD